MSAVRQYRRLARSIRKHLRSEKARLRRELPADEAQRAIAQLMRGVRRRAASAVVPGRDTPARGGDDPNPRKVTA